MNEHMQLGERGAKLMQGYESLQLVAYVDTFERDPKTGVEDKSRPVYACGFGHTYKSGPPVVHEGDVWTEDYANEVFILDTKEAQARIHRDIKIPLTQCQYDALTSLSFNTSTTHWKEFIEKSEINSGKFDQVEWALMRYTVSRGRVLAGLVRRRHDEWKLFNLKPEETT